MLKFYLRVHKIFYLLSYFSNHPAYIWYTNSNYGRCSSKIISSTMSSFLPPHPPIPLNWPPPPPHTHTHTNYDQDVKVKVLIFYLIDKSKFRRAILSGNRSCFFFLFNRKVEIFFLFLHQKHMMLVFTRSQWMSSEYSQHVFVEKSEKILCDAPVNHNLKDIYWCKSNKNK